jgi:predicted site-specific integrase-resolvase
MECQTRNLVRTSSPNVDESFIGYLLRLTEVNRYERLSWILRLAEIENPSPAGFSFALSDSLNTTPLARLTGVDESRLAALLYVPVITSTERRRGDYSVFGSQVPHNLIRLKSPKICPACLKESNYIRKIWELAPVTVCPLHECLLVDECPNCGKPISWNRNEVSQCCCSCDWRDTGSMPVTQNHLRVTRQIFKLCGLPPFDKWNGLIKAKNPLSTLTVEDFIRTLSFVARHQNTTFKTQAVSSLISKRVDDLHATLSNACEVFDDWPERYYSFLERVRAQQDQTKLKSGIESDFRNLYHGLYYQLLGSQFDFMRTSFEEYLITQWDGGHVRPNKFNANLFEKRKYISKQEVCRRLHVELAWVDGLIEEGIIHTVIRKRRKSLTLIEAESLHRLINTFKKIRAAVKVKQLPHASKSVDLIEAVKILKRGSIGIGHLIKLILNEELLPCAKNPKEGLNCLRFTKETIMDYLKGQLLAFRGGDNLYIPEAAKLMGLSSQGAYFLAKKGIIVTQPSIGDNRPHLLVTRKTTEQFNHKYISSARLSKEVKLGPYYLTKLLRERGVEAESGPTVDGGIQYVFKKSDLVVVNVLEGALPKSRTICRPENHETSLIDITQTVKILGLTQKQIQRLITNGILTPNMYRVPKKDQSPKYLFNRFKIEKLSHESVNLTELILISVAAKMLHTASSSFRRKWIRTGKIKVIDLESIPARHYLLREDVQRVIKTIKTAKEEKTKFLNSRQAASLLGVNYTTVHKMEKAGKLSRVSTYNVSGQLSPLYSVIDVSKLRQQRLTSI